ncbi:MAG: aminoacyl-histidine dipeptidase [Ruminococcaceae bacterium]|nr:aminoacyl-histidine dipeptidase [Oscillospiraceae bacterium]
MALEHLEPRGVFRIFEELCGIPHGSRNTKAVSDWCVRFAKERGFTCYQDAADNVIIIAEASVGYENASAVILQGHLDMVCEKNGDCAKDMEREGLDLAAEGDFVFAKGTTLGGDDGIAVAMALAILDDPTIPRPHLEVVLTSDEEIGMLGAAALDVSPLRGRQLLNIDSEEEGVFTVSCAGGSLTRCDLPLTRAAFSGTALRIRVAGLAGGHSGVEIHKGRANADILLGRLLRAMEEKTQLRLVSAAGGLKDNAIPVEAEAVVLAANTAMAKAAALALGTALQSEYRVTDPGLTVSVAEADTAAELPMDEASTERAICFMTCAPNGVQAMSADIPGLVQTSLNLGILRTTEDMLTGVFCVRSSVESQKEMLNDRLRCLTRQLGGTVDVSGDYPAWAYRPDSPLRERMVEVFRRQYGYDPKIEAIHAGVECGLFCGKIPGLDCVSIGPDLTEIHTPREKMSISSVQRVWAFVLEVLKCSNE